MRAKIYCEHRWLHTHKGLPYEVTVKTMALPTGHRFTAQGLQAAYGRPLIRVHLGGHWMGDVALHGQPQMAETVARRFVERHLKIWEQVGLIGPHLSHKAALQGAEARTGFQAPRANEKHRPVGESEGNQVPICPEHGNNLR
jgi:hypothetical protein